MSKRRRTSGFVQRFLPDFFFGFLQSHFSVRVGVLGGAEMGGLNAKGCGCGADRELGRSLDELVGCLVELGPNACRKSSPGVGIVSEKLAAGAGAGAVGRPHPGETGAGFTTGCGDGAFEADRD